MGSASGARADAGALAGINFSAEQRGNRFGGGAQTSTRGRVRYPETQRPPSFSAPFICTTLVLVHLRRGTRDERTIDATCARMSSRRS